jgi:hypothetical protein
LVSIKFGRGENNSQIIKITIPENTDYNGLFDDIFAKYAASYELDKIKINNMSNLYELTYIVKLKSSSVMPKEFIEELRGRNGNLNILISQEQSEKREL